MESDGQNLPDSILLAISEDDPELFDTDNSQDFHLKLIALRKIVFQNKPKLLANLLTKDYFSFLTSAFSNSLIFFIQRSIILNSGDVCKLLHQYFIKNEKSRESSTFILKLAIDHERWEIADWLFDTDILYQSYETLTSYFNQNHSNAAEFLIKKNIHLKEKSALQENLNLVPCIIHAIRRLDQKLIDLCTINHIMPFPIIDSYLVGLDNVQKSKLNGIYCWYMRSGLAYARYHVPFISSLSNNMFGEIVDYI